MANLKAYDYDTQALRAAAARLTRCANALSNGSKPRISKIRGSIDENLVGDAGNALKARMAEMDGDVNTLVAHINGLARVLLKYAADLDRMAQALKAKMR